MLVMMRGSASVYEDRLNQLEIDRIVELAEWMSALECQHT